MPFKDHEARKAYDKARYEANKTEVVERAKMYCKTPAGKKSSAIRNWKHSGLINDDYSALYGSYLQAPHCNACKSEFKDSFDRCMDHDHDTGLFRQFLCRACNTRDAWLKHQTVS